MTARIDRGFASLHLTFPLGLAFMVKRQQDMAAVNFLNNIPYPCSGVNQGSGCHNEPSSVKWVLVYRDCEWQVWRECLCWEYLVNGILNRAMYGVWTESSVKCLCLTIYVKTRSLSFTFLHSCIWSGHLLCLVPFLCRRYVRAQQCVWIL